MLMVPRPSHQNAALRLQQDVTSLCGESYKHFTIVNYNSRVVMWVNL